MNTQIAPPYFYLNNGETLTPIIYGITSVKNSLKSSEDAVKEIIGTNETMIQKSISNNFGTVQLHFLILQLSVYYDYANYLSSSNHNVLIDVSQGIANGIEAAIGEFSRVIYDLFNDYNNSLYKELKENNADDPFDMGRTAKLVTSNIGGQCNIENLLAENMFEKLRIEEVASRFGIKLLTHIISSKNLNFQG